MKQWLIDGLKTHTGSILVERKFFKSQSRLILQNSYISETVSVKKGVEKLLKVSVMLFGKEAQEKEVLIDSTV